MLMVQERERYSISWPIVAPSPSLLLLYSYQGVVDQRKMASNVQDAIMLLGDSLTQGGWEPDGFAQRLACGHSS